MRIGPLFGVVLVLAATAAGCGSSGSGYGAATMKPNQAESSPPGDIPDTQAFVAYRPPGAAFSVKVPEGWGRRTAGGAVVFTDKLNAVRIQSAPARTPLTVAAARQRDLPRLAAVVPGFADARVSRVHRTAGPAIRITYRADGAPDAVTGKRRRLDVERYVFSHAGRVVVLTLSGPQGADNVDPWRLVTDSVRFSA